MPFIYVNVCNILIQNAATQHFTDDKYAVLQFGGGCNGCSMVDVTLKEGIEKQLLAQFPDDLIGVRDVTEHHHGEHSYY